MDPVSLAAAAVGLLAPFLQRIGEKTAEEVSETLSEETVPALKRLFNALKDRLRPGSYAGNQLEGVEERPDSGPRQQALRDALVEQFEADPAFAAEVESLVKEAQATAGVQVITATDAGAIAGRDVRQQGHYVSGRDITIRTEHT
ncbi:MAG: hypothetical protein M3203_06465 [Actinomycetota bacterium]|nr:hypothetical protein [Actinomycetota bacterium]